jgi:hypothetical protein
MKIIFLLFLKKKIRNCAYFFKAKYTEIDPQIMKKYSLTSWILEVFKIESE